MTKYLSNQKLWVITQHTDGFYYELRCKGTVIDQIKIDLDKQLELVDMGLINGQ